MYREASLSRISSRSLSKIKTKIQMAFEKPLQNHNHQPQTSSIPARSKSMKSLHKFKEDQHQQPHIPFAIAIKTGLVSSSRKASHQQTPLKNTKLKHLEEEVKEGMRQTQKHKNIIVSKKLIKNESIVGYSWYHQKGKELVSVCKKNEGKLLRYFAIREQKQAKTVKKVLAALEGIYLLFQIEFFSQSNKRGLISKQQSSKATVTDSDFILVIDQSTLSICNINKVISDIYSMIADGLNNMDTIANILGRRIVELGSKASSIKDKEVFLLIILVGDTAQKYRSYQINKEEGIKRK